MLPVLRRLSKIEYCMHWIREGVEVRWHEIPVLFSIFFPAIVLYVLSPISTDSMSLQTQCLPLLLAHPRKNFSFLFMRESFEGCALMIYK